MNRTAASQYLRSLVFPAVGQFDVDALPVPRKEAVFQHFAAARARLEGALQLTDAGKWAPAVLLFREAVTACARLSALATNAEPFVGDDLDAAFERLSGLLGTNHERLLSKLREQLVGAGSTEFDALPRVSLRMRAEALSRDTTELLDAVRPRSRSTRPMLDYAPFASFALTVLLLIGTVLYFMLQPTNIAKGKPALASSAAYETQPEGAVDGKNFGTFGFHSASEQSPWLRVDLQANYRLSEVKIWGRHDCCYSQSLPLVCEISTDGEHFTALGTRKDRFEQVEPWVLAPNGATARYLQIRSLNSTVLVLSEVEAFGDRVR